MCNMELTSRQKQIIAFIKTHGAVNGYPPSRKEIAEHFVFTLAGAQYHLNSMQHKGAIEITKNVARGIKCLV